MDTNNLDKMICNFRKDVIHKLETIKKIRIDEITVIINSININEENQVIKITKKELGHTYVVLILATILVTPFIFFADYGWENLLLTYTLGTSFYELFLKKIKNLK